MSQGHNSLVQSILRDLDDNRLSNNGDTTGDIGRPRADFKTLVTGHGGQTGQMPVKMPTVVAHQAGTLPLPTVDADVNAVQQYAVTGASSQVNILGANALSAG